MPLLQLNVQRELNNIFYMNLSQVIEIFLSPADLDFNNYTVNEVIPTSSFVMRVLLTRLMLQIQPVSYILTVLQKNHLLFRK